MNERYACIQEFSRLCPWPNIRKCDSIAILWDFTNVRKLS